MLAAVEADPNVVQEINKISSLPAGRDDGTLSPGLCQKSATQKPKEPQILKLKEVPNTQINFIGSNLVSELMTLASSENIVKEQQTNEFCRQRPTLLANYQTQHFMNFKASSTRNKNELIKSTPPTQAG